MDTIEPRVVVLERHRYSCMQFMYVFVESDIYLTSVTLDAHVKCLPNIAISCHQSTSGNWWHLLVTTSDIYWWQLVATSGIY